MILNWVSLGFIPLAVSALNTPPYKLHRRSGLVLHDSSNASLMTTAIGHYSRANYLNDGYIIGTFVQTTSTDFTTSNSTIKVVKSSDNGNTWCGNATVYTNKTYTNDIDNLRSIRLSISYSDDGGASWTFQGNVVTKVPSVPYGGLAEGIWEPFLRNAQDESLRLYYSEETNGGGANQDSKMRTSTNGGETWSEAKTISGANVTSRDGMLGVVNTGGSNLIAIFETTEDPNYIFVVDSVMSPDNGSTWGNRSRVFTPSVGGKSAGSPQIAQVGDTTVVSFVNSENAATDGYNGTAATILTSANGGRSWGDKYYVIPHGANEPGLLTLKGNSSLLLVTGLEDEASRQSGASDGMMEAQKAVLS